MEGATMPGVKQASTQKRTTKAAAVKVLGATGLGLSLVGSASASTIPTADVPQSDKTSPDQRFVLGEEEMADVSLATFYVFDKENAGSNVQLAYVVARRGCGRALCDVSSATGPTLSRPVTSWADLKANFNRRSEFAASIMRPHRHAAKPCGGIF
jgi:hypothetical protein